MMKGPLVAAFIGFMAINSAACSCGRVPSVADGLRRSDAVFLAKITAITNVGKDPYGTPRIRVFFDVSKVWKGHITAKFEMATLLESSLCEGFRASDAVLGKNLLVYAFLIADKYTTNICSRTGPASDDEVQKLGKWHPPLSHTLPKPKILGKN
jgi:hypothetical protein